MYRLEAIIASEPTLRSLSLAGAHIVPLGQNLSLVPMTDALMVGDTKLAGFWRAPARLGDVLAAAVPGPVAYVEAEFFGGDGMQSAQVWHEGRVVLGPLHQPEGELPEAGSPICQALQHLGVIKGDHYDEFDALGLDRHRETQDWLPSIG